MSIQLDDEVRRLVAESGLLDHQIAVLCGMSPSWVYLFRKQKLKDPGARALQVLYEHFTGTPLIKDQ